MRDVRRRWRAVCRIFWSPGGRGTRVLPRRATAGAHFIDDAIPHPRYREATLFADSFTSPSANARCSERPHTLLRQRRRSLADAKPPEDLPEQVIGGELARDSPHRPGREPQLLGEEFERGVALLGMRLGELQVVVRARERLHVTRARDEH